MGQCNDSHSAVVVATELEKALKSDINELPQSIALSHLEQKAAAEPWDQEHQVWTKSASICNSECAKRGRLKSRYNLIPTTNADDDVKSTMAGNYQSSRVALGC